MKRFLLYFLVLFFCVSMINAQNGVNCDEQELLAENNDMAIPTYEASQAAENSTLKYWGQEVEGEKSDAFKNMMWTVYIVENLSKLQSKYSKSVEDSLKWAKMYLDAFKCTSGRACCPPRFAEDYYMDLHNQEAIRGFLSKHSSPLLSADSYAQMLYNYMTTESTSNPLATKWFHTRNPDAIKCWIITP